MTGSIFERYGGFVAVRKVISAFYDKVLDSPQLSRHFTGVDMRGLIDHQTKFVTYIMGGPARFSDAQIERVHARLGVTRAEFREAVDLMAETLEDHDFAAADVEQIRHELVRRERLVVTRD
jgi:hemoglobin